MNGSHWLCTVLVIAATTTSECPNQAGRNEPRGDRPRLQEGDREKSADEWIAEAQKESAEAGDDAHELQLDAIAEKFERAMRLDPSNAVAFVEHTQLARRIRTQDDSVVGQSLYWLAKNQIYDGSWSYLQNDLAPIPDPGASKSRIEATAVAMLPFLGAGYIHLDQKSKYMEVVANGLRFLISEMQVDERRGDLRGEHGDMTTHGLAALVICESFGMSNDWKVRAPSQAAVRFIEHMQNTDGGWSAKRGDKSDLVVSHWQMMALHSAALSELDIAPKTVEGFRRFLTSMQSDDGPYFGRTEAGKDLLGTAVGLYWRRRFEDVPPHDERLHLAAVFLLQDERKLTDCVASYLVSMAMYQYDGPDGQLWKKRNKQLVDWAVENQVKEGFARRTWFTDTDANAKHGGRLFVTAMHASALEVYYRYLPVYQQKNTFKLPVANDDGE